MVQSCFRRPPILTRSLVGRTVGFGPIFEAADPLNVLSSIWPAPPSALSLASLNARLLAAALCLTTGLPAMTFNTLTIASFSHITKAKIGMRMGTKGEGCRTISLSPGREAGSGGMGLYGSAGTGLACIAMIMYAGKTRPKIAALARLVLHEHSTAVGRPNAK